MRGSLAVFDEIAGRRAAALLVDGRLEDLLIDPAEDRIRPGTIYRAKAGRPMKGQGGLVCETPDGPLFLREGRGVSQGQMLLLQTTTWAEPGKAAPATRRLLFKSRFAMVTPGKPGLNLSRAIKDEERRVDLREALHDLKPEEDIGVVVRTAAAYADEDAVREDIQRTLALATVILAEGEIGVPERLLDGPGAEELAIREWPTPDVTDADPGSLARHGIDAMIAALREPHVPLPSGASLFIEPTRALTAVDVNTGADTSVAAALKTNLATVKELPRQLRLRGLGGQIVIDVAPIPKGQRRQVETALKAALKKDVIETALVGWTPLGHMELMRKRERLPIAEALR